MIVIESLSGIVTTGYALQLNQTDSVTSSWSKYGAVTVDVNGTSGDFWVKPIKQTDGTAPSSVPADPRVAGGALDPVAHGWYQVKSGERVTIGAASSKGYDAQMHGQNFYTHLLVYCVTPGTTMATQLRWVAN